MKTMTKAKRNLVLIITIALILATAIAPVSAKNRSGVVDTTTKSAGNFSNMKLSDNYEEVASDGELTLSADMQSGLIALKNKTNGYIWYGVPNDTKYDGFSKGEIQRFSKSQLIVGYVNAEDENSTARVAYLDSASAVETNVEAIDNGIRVSYTFDVDLSTNVTNTDGGSGDNADGGDSTDGDTAGDGSADEEEDVVKIVQVTVPVTFQLVDGHFEGAVEFKNAKFTSDVILTDYALLPYFGAGNWTDSGYIFVPDGSGALINFKGHENDKEYSEMVYGNDLSLQTELKTSVTETIRMPVFGIVHDNQNALFGVISSGAAASSIVASPSGSSKGYSTVNAKYNYKLTSSITMFGKSSNKQVVYRLSDDLKDAPDFKVNYYLLSGKNADYIGMANTYRKYLEDNKMLTKNISEPALNVDAYGAVEVKANLLGFNYDKLTSLTSYEQLGAMSKELKSTGIDDLSLRYIGWGNTGVTNKNIASKAKLLGLLGGKSKYNDLLKVTKDQNVTLYQDSDLLTFTKGKNKYAAKTGFSEVYYEYQYLRSVYATDLNGIAKKLLLPSALPNYSESFIKSYQKLGNKNVSFSTLSNMVYSHLKKGENEYRTEFPKATAKTYEQAKAAGLNVAGDTANDYTFQYLSKIYKAPLYSSGYNLFDSEVPFYEIVLHGYIPMTGDSIVQSVDSQTTYLKCVEAGVELLWDGIYEDSAQLRDTNYDDLYGSTYTLWKEDAAGKYKEYQPLLKKIYDQKITAHSEVAFNVTKTVYENGISVYVNYSDNAVTVNGVKVPARSFTYKEG